MATLTSTTHQKFHFRTFPFLFSPLFICLLVLLFTNGLLSQSVIIEHAKAGIIDSTELRLEGFSPEDINTEDSWYEYFWIYGNGNFSVNSRETFARERYLHRVGTFNPPYDAKVYSTSVYRSRGRVPTKMEESVITNPTDNVAQPDSIRTTPAVQSGYLHLQFNHNEIVPGDTTIWVLSIKNPLKNNPQNTFLGDVYLFFNSPIKIHNSGVEVATPDTPDDIGSGRVVTNSVKEQTLEADSETPRFSDFVYDTAYIFNNNFWPQQYDIEGRINTFSPVANAYKNALLWHFDGLQGQEERHLFIEFKDAENIFASGADSLTRVVDFLAVLTSGASGNVVVSLLDTTELKIVSDLQLDSFIADMAASNTSNGITPDILNSDFSISNRIIDLFQIQPLAKRAHDPNQLTILACACPPESDGAQKLIFTVEFENDGNANAYGARIAIPMDALIDVSSIDDLPLAFFGPGLTENNIQFSLSENQDSVIWELEGMNVFSTKEVGSGDSRTYGQVSFTALTKPGSLLEDISEMKACIQFVDHIGLTTAVCTRSVKPHLLSQDKSKTLGTQEELQCEECVLPGCQFPLWMIILIVMVAGFVLWIVFDKR